MSRSRSRRSSKRRSRNRRSHFGQRAFNLERLEIRAAPGDWLAFAGTAGLAAVGEPEGPDRPENTPGGTSQADFEPQSGERLLDDLLRFDLDDGLNEDSEANSTVRPRQSVEPTPAAASSPAAIYPLALAPPAIAGSAGSSASAASARRAGFGGGTGVGSAQMSMAAAGVASAAGSQATPPAPPAGGASAVASTGSATAQTAATSQTGGANQADGPNGESAAPGADASADVPVTAQVAPALAAEGRPSTHPVPIPGDIGSGGGIFAQAWTGGGGVPMSMLDPYYVIDWNDGLTLSTENVEYESEGDSVDLRAQTQGATVLSYEWDLSQAPDALDVTGENSYHLQFNWGDIFDGNSSSNQITLTITYLDFSTTVLDYSFEVINDGSAEGSGGGSPPVSVQRPEVVTPDLISAGQETIGGDRYALGAATGELRATHFLPSYDPGAPVIGLSYNSESAAPQPIFLDHYELDPSAGIPDTVSAKLTFNGVAGQEYYYTSSDLNPGDIVQIGLQADATSLGTGRYDWQIDVTAHYSGGDVTTSNMGEVTIVNHSASALGAGWQVAAVGRLHPLADGAILDLGTGHSLWFDWDPVAQSYVTPKGDFSTLVKNGDGTYTRGLKSGEVLDFDTNGRQTSFVDRNDSTVSYAYDAGGNLTSITDPNALVTNFAYAGGVLSSITDPAGRATNFTHDANSRLAGITDPDSAAWAFSYDSAGRMTGRTDPLSNATGFTYNFAGRVNGVTRADGTSDALVPWQTQGLLQPGTGTPSAPEAAVMLAGAASTYTDGRGNDWTGHYDWTGFGKSTGSLDPRGYLFVTHRDQDGLATQRTDQLDRNTVLDRDEQGNVTKITHQDFSTETLVYNGFSQVTDHTDAGGKVYSYAYDTDGNLTQVTDPLLKTQSFTYTVDGLVATSTDQLGHVTKFSYDTRDRLTEVILPDETPGNDADNSREQRSWDNAGNLVDQTDPLDRVTLFDHDTVGRLTKTTLSDDTPADPNDNPTYSYSYGARGNLITETDPVGNVTTWAYDQLGRVTSVTDPLSNQNTYGYDAEGNQTSVTDPLNGTTSFAYDPAANLTQITDPLNNTTSFTVDSARQIIEQIDPLAGTTSIAYNSRGWVSSVTDPADGAVYKGYTSQGWLDAMQQSGGGTVDYSYDDLGRVTAFTDELGNQTTFAYDDAGNLTSRTDPLTNTTTWAYDAQNRVTSVTDPLNNTTAFAYDLKRNLLSVTDPLNRTTSYNYDAQDRVTKITDPAGEQTLLAYDLAGRLASVTDANSNVTSYSYDAVSRLTTETDPLGNATSYSYDNSSQLTSIEDRNGRERTFVYDDAGRRTAEKWLDDLGVTIRTISYGYDGDGNLTSVSDPDASYAFTYDADGRLTGIDNAGTPGMPNVVLSFGYDARDNRTTFSDNLGGQVTYGYDLADRMTSADLAVDGITRPSVTLGYDAAGRLSSLNRSDLDGSGGSGGGYPVPIDTTFGYDAAGRVTGISHTADSNPLADYTFAWDAAGQLTQEVSDDGTLDFTYDLTGQLTGVTGWRTENYTFDPLGNRTISGYQTGAGNRLLSDGTFNYTYDNEGNMLTKTEIATGKVTDYTWDHRNRLTNVKVKGSGGSVIQESNYTYDAFDKRIGVSVDPDGDGPEAATERWTVYDGANPYADFDGSGSLTERYLYGPAVDMIMARLDDAGDLAWYLTDHLGTVRDLADTTGTVIDHIQYDSFGNVLSETNPDAGDRFKFTGREYDSETGLYYYRARYYESEAGRFISNDPIGFEAGDANFFRYVGNGPTNATDPSGLQGLFDVIWDEIELLPGTLYNLPGCYWETACSGEQLDSLNGWTNGVTDSLNPFGGGLPTEAVYGNYDAYSGGQSVGYFTGIVLNSALTVYGISGTVSAIRSIQAAGGLGSLYQVGQLSVAGGGSITFVVLGGEAVPLTAQLAGSLGISLAGTGMAFSQINDDMGGSGGSNGPGGAWQREIEFYQQELDELETIRDSFRGEEWRHAGDELFERFIRDLENSIEDLRQYIQLLQSFPNG